MEALVENISKFSAGRVTTQQETVQFTAVLVQALANLPPLPLHEELTPSQGYYEHVHNAVLLQTLSESIMKNFDHNCQVKFCASVVARVIQPSQVDQICSPEICRRIIWSYDQGKLCQLDIVSYAYMLILASLHSKHKTFFFDYDQGSDEDNEDPITKSEKVEQYFNSVSNTLLVFKTEVGLRRNNYPYNFVFQLIQVAELIIVIKQMAPNATEELTYEVVCAKVGQLFLSLFKETSQYLERNSQLSIKQLWLFKSGQRAPQYSTSFSLDPQDEAQQISLLVATSACLPLHQIQRYIEQVNKASQEQRKREEALQRETQKAHEVLRQYQDQKGAYLIQGSVISEANATYKRFPDLSEREQHAIKFKATESLISYIRLKRQLGVANGEVLFEDDALQGRQLKQTQLKQHLDNGRLRAIKAQAESLVLTSKADDVAVLPTFKTFVGSLEPVRLSKDNYLQTEDRRIPAAMAMPLSQYCQEVRKTLFHQLYQQLRSWDSLRLILTTLVRLRAVYGNRLFGTKKFADIMTFYDPSLNVSQEEPAPVITEGVKDTKFAVKTEDVVLVDANNKIRKTKITVIEPRPEEQPLGRTRQPQPAKKNVQEKVKQVHYTRSTMRLVLDNSILGTTHDTILAFIRWLSVGAKTKNDQTRERKLIDLRNFSMQITDRLISGGLDFGFVPYVEDFNIVQYLVENEEILKTYSPDEAASILISAWVLPYNLDLYPQVQGLVALAIGCNPVLMEQLKQMLGDLYIYLDCGMDGFELANQLFDASDQ